ncbi:hypothetical protein [Candidatus Magnetominusculus xianensis]|uniref:Secreted protein containing DUF1302 n=1 Tax=Candidatus Magnetominusculus xianensis TaxID=1748249 RepID=A0ABR5SC86_9BACT|nr:hypothetical protein [Candidatus Magnetominusculus xianensis]KWT79597.1 hypothetical protein ASN18_2694 [Candidatus Magnetominusculus xianensis]MBF0403810.1 hypothetical protein [Nitrospirota bacterium]
MMINRVFVYIFIGMGLFISTATASEISLHGFLQGNYSVDTAYSNPNGGDFKRAEERLQLKLDASKDPFHIFVKTDALYDHVDNKARLELREGYFDFRSSAWDVRLGRQIITWGVGDLVFINDVFPKDFEAFFSGRPLEYLKKGVDGAKIGIYPAFASFDIIAIPFFTPNHYPGPQRFWMFDPMPDVTDRETTEPSKTPGNTELAIRAYRDVAGFDTSLYLYRGFYRQPSAMPNDTAMPSKLFLSYPKLSVYGASFQGRALDGILSLEMGYYDFRQDRSGSDPFIPNSQTRTILGYQRQMWDDFSVSIQFYTQYMHNYSEYVENLPEGFTQEKRLYSLASLRLTQLLAHQTLKLSFFSFWSPSDGDYIINPEARYNFTDHVWGAIGANIFGGPNKSTQFGQFDKNDNVYVQVRYEF